MESKGITALLHRVIIYQALFSSSDSFARNKKVTEIDFCLQVIVTQILTHAHDSISVCLINITHHHDFTKFITLTSQNGERYCHSYVCKHKTVY